MEDFKTLKLLDKFQVLFLKLGIDYQVMRNILQIKMVMDERRVPTLFNQSTKKKNEEKKYGYIKSLWIYTLLGLILIPLMNFGQSYLFQMSLTYGIIIFIIITTLISDFSTVLLDIRDRTILSTKPISAKTINAAKFMHIFIYLTYLTIAFTGIPLLVALFNKGILFFLITLVQIILISLFVVALTAIIYIVILRFFDGEKLKDIINYAQIGLTIALIIGYQVIARTFELVNLDIVLEFHWWTILLVPMWFAAAFELFLNGDTSLPIIIFSIFSIIVPIIAIAFYIKLIPTFERNLQKLSNISKSKEEKNYRIKELFLQTICQSNEEKAFYRFASSMMKQEREFKLKVYPNLGLAFVFPFLFMLNLSGMDKPDYSTSLGYLSIYFCTIIIPSALVVIGHSVKYKAAWLLKTVPVKDMTLLQKGTLKAFLVKLFIPLFVLLSIVFTYIYGSRIIIDLFIVLASSFLYTIICFIGYGKEIPFTKPYDEMGDKQGWKGIVLMIPIGIMVGIHYLVISIIPYGDIIYLLALIVVNYIVWKKTFQNS